MSYKLSVMLSMLFVVAFFLIGGDMICLSAAYSELDSASITIAYLIAKTGRVDNEFITYLSNTYKVNFLTISPSSPLMGDVVDFVIYRNYDPLILSNEPMVLKASRSTVIGYYG